MRLVIPGRLPGMNEYITAERQHRQKAAAMKRQCEHAVILCIKSQLRGKRFVGKVQMDYTWYEKSQRRDKDNVSSMGRKITQDALVRSGAIQNDGWANIPGFSDKFAVDTKNPRIEVEITEVSECQKTSDKPLWRWS